MKTKLYALALAALLAPAASAQDQAKECSKSTSCDAKAELASVEGDCSSAEKAGCEGKAELASTGGDCAGAAKAGCEGKAELASSDGECSGAAKAGCEGKAELASSDGECSGAAKAACHGKAELAASGGGECASKGQPASISACAQLASLMQPSRVAGVVIDGKVYLGQKAAKACGELVRANVSAKIKANCAESAACEKTLAANVDKALAGGTCAVSQLASLVEAGKVTLIVDDESVRQETATAALAKIGSCPEFQAECRERAGVAKPAAAAVKTASFEPVSVDLQLAAMVTESRVAGVVVDGKMYLGKEAVGVLDGLIRAHVATEIKVVCEQSRACEKTLASNVDMAMAQKVCAGTQLATLIESGELDGLVVGDKVLTGCEAKTAVQGILSCSEFQKECRELASAAAPKAACTKGESTSL